MLGNRGTVAKATKFLCLEDVSWPNWCLYQVSTWLVSKEQNYCRVFVFSLFRVFVFQLFKMLGNTGMVAKATKFLCLEDVPWPNWCLYQVSTWLVSKEKNYCRVFVFSLFRVFVFWVLGLRSLFSESSFSECPWLSVLKWKVQADSTEGLRETSKITFSLAKSICESYLNIIANQLSRLSHHWWVTEETSNTQTKVTYRLTMNDPNKQNCRSKTLI